MNETNTIETIADADLWEAICDGVNTISSKEEAAFEFEDDRLRVRVKDAANVAMIAQTVPADAFEHYAVAGEAGEVVIGVNTGTFDDLLSAADTDTVEFNLNAKTRMFDFEGDGVEYELAGIDPDSMNGSPVEVPALSDDYEWAIDADLPVDNWERGTDVVDLAGSSYGTFVFDPQTGEFALEGKGDTDTSRVVLSDDDAFRWHGDAPDQRVECNQSNDYMPEIISVIDEDAVRIITGNDLPYHVTTDRADGRIETKLLQAPRIVSD